MTSDTTYNALFICTGNSARSILAEGVRNELGQGRFRACSAGSHPKGEVYPLALATLERLYMSTAGCRSKSRDAFVAPGAAVFDFISTVCDTAAVEGSEEQKIKAFKDAAWTRQRRVVAVPVITTPAPGRHVLAARAARHRPAVRRP